MTPKQMAQGLRECCRFVNLHRRFSLLGAGVQPADPGAGPAGIVVTLSTLPSRIGKILPALNSLLDQTVMPDRIFISLPPFSRREQKAYDVPEGLRNHPVVTLLPAERDWGPATKLIPVLRHFEKSPETAILAVDDDNVYPRTFLATFLRYATAIPDAAFSLRGCSIPVSRRWKDCREFKGSQLTSPAPTDIIEGCGGILVRPRFFDADFFDYAKAPPEAFFVDDIWISGHLARRSIPKYVLPFSGAFVYLPSLTTFSGTALDRGENRSGKNNDVMIDYFGAYWGSASRPLV
jgi:hypothetical protein